MASRSFRRNEAERVDGPAAVGVAREVQPQQREAEAAFHSVRGLSVGDGQDREMRRTAPEKAAGVVARDGMLEIGRNRQSLQSFIGKLFREKTAEGIAECFAREVALGALVFEANEFEPVRLGASEALDSKREPLLGVVGDGQHAARQIVILRPEMKQRLL